MVLPPQNNPSNTAKKDVDWFSPNSNPSQPNQNSLNNKPVVNPNPPIANE
jgi:hypothetical protein